jgi:glycosyltransferase involved in cell wall biosynthesis
MIASNEEDVIKRCLDSVKPLIGSYVIGVNNTQDQTREIIKETLSDVPGIILEHPWKNFGWNRSQTLKEGLDWIRAESPDTSHFLLIDADEKTATEEGFVWPELVQDGYQCIFIDENNIAFPRGCLIRADLDWSYKYRIHEQLECGKDIFWATLPGIQVRVFQDGHRHKDPDRLKKDLELLRAGWAEEKDIHYLFFLGQILACTDQFEEALERFREYATYPMQSKDYYWYAKYRVASFYDMLGYPDAVVINAFMDCIEIDSTRKEPFGHLAQRFRNNGKHNLARTFAITGMHLPICGSLLWRELVWDMWMLQDEAATACFRTGYAEDGLKMSEELVQSPHTPQAEKERIMGNINKYLQIRDANAKISPYRLVDQNPKCI